MTDRPFSQTSGIEPGVITPSDAMITYSSYLKVTELISLQSRLSEPAKHDEMLFIIIHQVYELWFKQILHEMDRAEDQLVNLKSFGALKTLKRITTIQGVLTEH